MSITKTAVIACALLATTAAATAGATAPTAAGDATPVILGKGTEQITTKASPHPELLGQAPPAMLQASPADTRRQGPPASAKPELLRQGPPMSGLSFFTACRAAVRKCLVMAPRSVLSCVFSMPPSNGAMTSDCSAWIARRDRTTALLKENPLEGFAKGTEAAGSGKGMDDPERAAFARTRKAGSTNEAQAGHPGAQAVHHQVEFEV